MSRKFQLINIERLIENKYNHLLAMLVAFLIYAPSLEQGIRIPGIRVVTSLLLFTIVLCLRVTVSNKRVFWICAMFALLFLVLDIIGVRIEDDQIRKDLRLIVDNIVMVFISMTIVLLMMNMFRTRRIDANMIVGGICIYLLIGILFASVYTFLNNINFESIAFERSDSMYYFSFVTLTTLGYGDVVPRGRYVMMIASFEAIAGQMFIAIFVARLVGLHVACQFKADAEKQEIE